MPDRAENEGSYGCLDCGETTHGSGWNCSHCGSSKVTSNMQRALNVKRQRYQSMNDSSAGIVAPA
jgi:DNA-directed RNA polymerase subunit RPC12/RpoP